MDDRAGGSGVGIGIVSLHVKSRLKERLLITTTTTTTTTTFLSLSSTLRLTSSSFELESLLGPLRTKLLPQPYQQQQDRIRGETLEEEFSRSARDELRKSWDLERAEAGLASFSDDDDDSAARVVDDSHEEEGEERREAPVPVPVSRSMEELREAMQEFSADELTRMLDGVYRG